MDSQWFWNAKISQLVLDSSYILLMSEMGRGSSLDAAEVHYLLSLRELCYWIFRFDEECLSNGAFLMHHVPKSVKYLYISVQLKTGFSIGNRNQGLISVSVTELNLFFLNRNFFFQSFSNFLMFFCFLGGYRFLKAWNWTQIFKKNLKYSAANLV